MKFIPVADRPKTILIDIDGVIFKQGSTWPAQLCFDDAVPNPGVRDKLTLWHMQGHRIVLLTARPAAYRYRTERQLENAGLLYHEVVYDLPTGTRILINDAKPEEADTPTAVAVNLDRDAGLEGVLGNL